MYFRNDFITNSSSTSYIIITNQDIDADYLIEKLGIKKDNPLYNDFYDVCSGVVNSKNDGLYHHSREESFSKKVLEDTFGSKDTADILKLINKGNKVYFGKFSSEYDFEACLEFDHFVINDKDFYMNATPCVY